MKGTAFVATLSEKGAGRDSALLQAARAGMLVVNWVPLEMAGPGVEITYFVTSDVVRWGEPDDCVRLSCGHRTHQLIADGLDAVLPTIKLSDEIYRQADLKLTPLTHEWYADGPDRKGTMGFTSRMVEQSRLIDQQIAGRPHTIVAGHHKDWVNSGMLGTTYGKSTMSKWEPTVPAGVNYGMHSPGSGPYMAQTIQGVKVVQPASVAHGFDHSDYSQYLRLVARTVLVCRPSAVSGLGATTGPSMPCTMADGTAGVMSKMDIYDMPTSPLKGYLGHEGAWLMRHPMVPWASGSPPPFTLTSPVDLPSPGELATAGGGLSKALAFVAGGAIAWYGLQALERFVLRKVR